MGRGGPSGYRLLAWRGGARFHVPAGLVGGFCLTTTRVPDRTHATIRDIVGHVTGSITGFITGCLTETIAPPCRTAPDTEPGTARRGWDAFGDPMRTPALTP